MTEAEFLQADDRIHCIFYFIAPHRFKAIDAEFIKELAPLASIIPVVAKADIMTVKVCTIHHIYTTCICVLTVYMYLSYILFTDIVRQLCTPTIHTLYMHTYTHIIY